MLIQMAMLQRDRERALQARRLRRSRAEAPRVGPDARRRAAGIAPGTEADETSDRHASACERGACRDR